MRMCQFHDQALGDGAGRQSASGPGRAQCTSACASILTGCARPSAEEDQHAPHLPHTHARPQAPNSPVLHSPTPDLPRSQVPEHMAPPHLRIAGHAWLVWLLSVAG